MNFAGFFANTSLPSYSNQDNHSVLEDSGCIIIPKSSEQETPVPKPSKNIPYGVDLGIIIRQLDGVFLISSVRYEHGVKLAMADIPDDVPFLEKLEVGQWMKFTTETRKGDYFVVGFALVDAPYVSLPLSYGSVAVQCKVNVPPDGSQGSKITSEVSPAVYDVYGLLRECHRGKEINATVVYSPKENKWIIEYVI